MLQPPPHIDQSLLRAYEQTHYCLPSLNATVKVGSVCPPLEEWLADHGIRCGAFVTAYNPGSAPHTAAENQYWQATLQAELDQWQQAYLPAIHRDPSGRWPEEPAYFVLELEAVQAITLGRRYGQNAVLGYEAKRGATLWWCQ